jgi:P4 family phage/plasmid primase-like protien
MSINTSPSIKCKYKDLQEFLAKHTSKDKSKVPTHTRIPDKQLNIYGGAYHIPEEELLEFFQMYYDNVFQQKKMEYLTEKQNELSGPCMVDLDFRYSPDVTEKQHNAEGIQDFIFLYLEKLKELYVFEENKPFIVCIMEKPNVNRQPDVTKDGIHMIIGIEMERTMQIILRDRVLDEIPEIWGDLPLTNTWDKVLDEGISKGTTNWQMYGSRKPGNERYELTKIFSITFDKNDGEFMMDEVSIKDFDLSKNIMRLSAQYKENPKFEMNSKIMDLYNKRCKDKNAKEKKKQISKTKVKLIVEEDEDESFIPLEEIDCKEKLERAVDNLMKNLGPSEHFIKEIHEYTQILPAKYYEPGSHLLNRQVAFALKHTDERLFLSWILLRSKATDFDYTTIPELYLKWKKHFNTKKEEGITKKSIIYWAKQDAYDDYVKVKKSTVDNCIEETLVTCTEYDCAMVLYQMFKDKYVCSSIQNKQWYVFRNHRWVLDQGHTLRMAISKDMYNVYQEKIDMCNNEIQHYENSDDRYEFIKKKMNNITSVSIKFKRTTDKNNIMREAMELFYDGEFIKNMDTNRYLMCFNNGVVDFKNKTFRDGFPQDYITKTTGIAYVPFDSTNEKMFTMSKEIITFMEQLFPVEELNRYMWSHLASCLIGVNLNQTFNVYRGSGSNGKSKLIDLMTHGLGQYKGTVPITLVTEKRNGIGGTSSEVIALKGVRYAVMQEPSKGAVINEGVMKELTGGDPIQARALYSESETFIPQFKLIACTNNLFEINSNDDGTWRRFRICDFMSKFVGDNETHTDSTPYVFPKDMELEEKIVKWAPVFMSMLVKMAYETQGVVEDCDIVKASTNKYRHGQDHIAAFVEEMVMKTGNMDSDRIKKTELTNEFKTWFANSQGNNKRAPKGVELYEFMDKKFGKCRSTGWHGVTILYPDQQDAMKQMNDQS